MVVFSYPIALLAEVVSVEFQNGGTSPVEEPRIIAFCCMYCAYAAADAAGSMRLNYPPNVHIVLMPCSGRVDDLFILKAFESGADGVYIAGCEEGSCHFVSGNLRAKRRVFFLKRILEEIGIEPERLEMFHISASQGGLFARVAKEMTEKVRLLGIIKWNKS
ncbi:MAG: hydrogenase iron-sulfur subunit [Syntrophobacterales bacterium]|nr:hydrogenase iron-sulfur subunit [Syntrophobacterales bacterium]